MYAVLPSSDTATSCGSLPTGTRATMVRLAGSTMTRVFCAFSRTSKALAGVLAALRAAGQKPRNDKQANLIGRMVSLPTPWISAYYRPPLRGGGGLSRCGGGPDRELVWSFFHCRQEERRSR